MLGVRRSKRANWARVLEAMYERELTIGDERYFGRSYPHNPAVVDRFSKDFALRFETGLDRDVREDAIEELILTGFVEEVEIRGSASYGLTQEGFKMAHQIKSERQRRRTNAILLLLTGILVVLTAMLVL